MMPRRLVTERTLEIAAIVWMSVVTVLYCWQLAAQVLGSAAQP
ncbi:MAG: hypothetical protein U1E76_19835 [Planctomycetota bacterium]